MADTTERPDERTAGDYDAVFELVSGWSLTDRLALIQDILRSIEPEIARRGPRRRTLDHARGLLAGPWPTPSDADVERLIDEYRSEKHG